MERTAARPGLSALLRGRFLRALGGAALLTLADLAVRHLSGPGQPLYLGVLTALIGAPFFLWLVRSTRRLAP